MLRQDIKWVEDVIKNKVSSENIVKAVHDALKSEAPRENKESNIIT